ncbi:MAG: YiiG family protein [Burkholderiaceae bacterium]|jgi:hypothetical protein|nr:YiiG family protein [Burkholderiaceae bacterium]
MKPYSILLSVVLVVCVGLMASCKRPGSESAQKSSASSQAVQSRSQAGKPLNPEQLAAKKLAVYADVYSLLVDSEQGLPDAYRTFMKKVVKAKPSDDIDFPVAPNLGEAIAVLKQSRSKATTGQESLDAAADKLVTATDKLAAHEKELVPYFSEKAYRADGMSRARKYFPEVQADYEAALAALSGFGAEIMAAKRAVSEKHIAAFRAGGDIIRSHTEEIMMLSEELLALFDDPKVPFNRGEAFAKGNSLAARLDKAIQAQRKGVEEAKSKPDAKVSPYYDAIRNLASGIITDYREVRDKRSETAFTAMLKKYDEAVKDYNSVQVNSAQPDNVPVKSAPAVGTPMKSAPVKSAQVKA